MFACVCVLQADVQEISGEAYIVFGIILFFWELLPTSLVVVFFRVQRPNQNLVKSLNAKSINASNNLSDRSVIYMNYILYSSQAPGGMINSHSFSSRAYFFDNPRRYDSDDDLSRSINSRTDRARWAHTHTSSKTLFQYYSKSVKLY